MKIKKQWVKVLNSLLMVMLCVTAWLVITGNPLHAVSAALLETRKQYVAKTINPHPPTINGKMDDVVWEKAYVGGEFIQLRPYEGKDPSQPTEFRIMYDDNNLYIIVRAYDNEPAKIVRRMSRRDSLEGDKITVQLDSYFDKRTAFCFSVNAAGVKGDEIIAEDGNLRDNNWDPIWYVDTAVDDNGWTAEMRIPLSQLRFNNKDIQVWGMQVSRLLFRTDESSSWQFIPQDASGLVNQFGELHGLTNLKAKRQAQVMPYFVGNMQRYENEAGNPFATGKASNALAGLDGKIGLTNNLTLDFTINPDFGQVEADPSEVNLTAFETYFAEKRPFFIEGRNILSFPLMIGDGDFSSDNLFYTRRIGRPPHHTPDTTDYEYLDSPENTSILGAFKITGKTQNGWSVGVIDSVTAAEYATIGNFAEQRKEMIEPLTNYLGLRLQKDFNGGNTIMGGMLTAVNRRLDGSPQLDFLHKAAYSGGFDFFHNWQNKKYFISFSTAFSHVQGSPEAILETQQSALRYYQRPDASHVTLDPTRTSLTGHGGNLNFGKLGSGHFNYAAGVTWRSPGLELNDMGYLRQADVIMEFVWMGYRYWQPFSIFRSINVSTNQWMGWDFSGERTFQGGNIHISSQLKNYYNVSLGVNFEGENLSKSELRGGPSLRLPGGKFYSVSLGSDSRKKFKLGLRGAWYAGQYDNLQFKNIQLEAEYRPSMALSLAVMPSYSFYANRLQYVDTVELADNDKRYLMATINQETVGITLRMNLSLTPDLSIQFYGQPFVSAGKYADFKRITNPRAEEYSDRFRSIPGSATVTDSTTGEVMIDEDVNGTVDYRLANPNFNFLQFRANLVIRWETKPGSAIYLVWSQGRTGIEETGDFAFAHNIGQLFDVYPHNVFLVKFTHCFSL